MRISNVKKPLLSAVVFFGTLLALSVGYAALNGGISTSDKVVANAALSSASWNRIVDGVLDLDARTAGISTNGGNVGIGTIGPAQKLEVTGNILVARHSGAAFSRFVGIGAASGDMVTGTSGGSYIEFVNSGSPNDDSMHFITHKGGVSHARRMTIDPFGNVGIGTASPVDRLHVKGDVSIEKSNGASRCRLTTYVTACSDGYASLGCTGGKCLCYYCY